MILNFILAFSLFQFVYSYSYNFTLNKYETKSFTCASGDGTFDFYVQNQDYDDYLSLKLTFALKQEIVRYNSNATKEVPFNETIKVKIDYVYKNEEELKTEMKYESESQGNTIINYFIVGQKGNFALHLACLDVPDISTNHLSLVFFPEKINLVPIEFDTGYKRIENPGYFSGTYSRYETYVIYAIYNIKEEAYLHLTLDECVGSVLLLHYNSNGVNDFVLGNEKPTKNQSRI